MVAKKSSKKFVPCSICGRKFFENRVQKHENICNKYKKDEEKRKANLYDPYKKRVIFLYVFN